MNRRDFLKIGVGLGAGFAGAKFMTGSNDSKLLIEEIIDAAYGGYSTNTYYRDTQNNRVDLPQLMDDASCDVCVVGGGLTGISTAFRLANAGYKVVLLEADKIANQASGMNGGQVLTAYECGMEYFEDKFGDDFARKLWQLSLEAVSIVKDNIRKYDIKCDWQSGTGITAFLEKHVADLEEEYEIMTKKYHYNHIRLLDKKETCDIIDSDLYYGCLYDDFAGHMHPLNYALGMTKATLSNSNACLYEKSRATAIKFNQSGKHLVSVNGKYTVSANFVVLACNYNNSLFAPELAYKVAKFDTYVLATEPLEAKLASQLIKNRMSVFDSRNVMNYYRLTGNNSLIFGGGDTFGKADPEKVKMTLYTEMIKTFPQLAGIKVKNFWYGADSMTLSLAPNFGRLYDTVYYAQGYSGQGLALSNLAGVVIAEAIRGQAEKFDLFAQVKPFEVSNIAAVQNSIVKLGTYYFRMKDYFGL